MQLKAAEDLLKQADRDRRKTSAVASEAEEDGRSKEARIKDLTLRIESMDYDLCVANQKLCAAETELAELRRRLITSEHAAEAARGKADSTQQQMDRLQVEYHERSHRYNTLERQFTEDHHAKVELEAMLRHSEKHGEELQDRLSLAESQLSELRREASELGSLRVQLSDCQRQLATALEAKNGQSMELLKSEEALAGALSEANLVQRLREDLQLMQSKEAALLNKLTAAEATTITLETEYKDQVQRSAEFEAHLSESNKLCRQLDGELATARRHLERAEVERTAYARVPDAQGMARVNIELADKKRECEELAAGVEKLHAKAELERAMRLEVEARLQSVLATTAHPLPVPLSMPVPMPVPVTEVVTGRPDGPLLRQLAEERNSLVENLSQLAATLHTVWEALAPRVFPYIAPGTPPGDGQLTELAAIGSRLLRGAQSASSRLKDLVLHYASVLGTNGRRNAEAAFLAESTEDVDDFDVSVQLVSVILEKLVADVSTAKRVIEDQQQPLSLAHHHSLGEPISGIPPPVHRVHAVSSISRTQRFHHSSSSPLSFRQPNFATLPPPTRVAYEPLSSQLDRHSLPRDSFRP
ncbi:hypothetical protein DIPPA_02854 [Diplonema papillatum]|nr:hypothetical protein DIPPA_02854 [Diplonema papillatum]